MVFTFVLNRSRILHWKGALLNRKFFFERPTNPPKGLLAKIHHIGIHPSPNWGKPSPRAEAREHSPKGTTVR
ncbi:hypothetical protein Hanom_Chr13g01191791 [Helianthus anomalus]